MPRTKLVQKGLTIKNTEKRPQIRDWNKLADNLCTESSPLVTVGVSSFDMIESRDLLLIFTSIEATFSRCAIGKPEASRWITWSWSFFLACSALSRIWYGWRLFMQYPTTRTSLKGGLYFCFYFHNFQINVNYTKNLY